MHLKWMFSEWRNPNRKVPTQIEIDYPSFFFLNCIHFSLNSWSRMRNAEITEHWIWLPCYQIGNPMKKTQHNNPNVTRCRTYFKKKWRRVGHLRFRLFVVLHLGEQFVVEAQVLEDLLLVVGRRRRLCFRTVAALFVSMPPTDVIVCVTVDSVKKKLS